MVWSGPRDESDWSDYTDAAADLNAASTDLTAAAGDIADAQWSETPGDGWAAWSADSLNVAAQGYDTFGDSALEQAGTYADQREVRDRHRDRADHRRPPGHPTGKVFVTPTATIKVLERGNAGIVQGAGAVVEAASDKIAGEAPGAPPKPFRGVTAVVLDTHPGPSFCRSSGPTA